MGKFWVDANFFIWGSREPYPLPGARRYWDWVEAQVDQGRITSHWKAISELTEGESKKEEDPIVTWVKARKEKLLASADAKECQDLVGHMCQFCYEEFGSVKTAEFTRGADLWLIARASLDSGTVVTQESIKKQVRIPTVCKKFNVEHTTIFGMNNALGMSL